MCDSKACFKPLFAHQPVGRTFPLCMFGPRIKSGRHQGLIAGEGDHGSDAEWGNELAAANGFFGGHSIPPPVGETWATRGRRTWSPHCAWNEVFDTWV